jgi:hypothetical protein
MNFDFIFYEITNEMQTHYFYLLFKERGLKQNKDHLSLKIQPD